MSEKDRLMGDEPIQGKNVEQEKLLDQIRERLEEDPELWEQRIRDLFSKYEPASEGTTWSPLNTKKRREQIESQLEPIDLLDFLRRGYATQKVVIKKVGDQEFSVTYRSLTEGDYGELRRWFREESSRYEQNKHQPSLGEGVLDNLYELTLSIVEINGQPLDDVYKTNEKTGEKELDIKAAQKRRLIFRDLPELLVADMLLNLEWFKERVLKVYSGDVVEGF